MKPAQYPAASPVPDQTAPGGFSPSSNLPTKIPGEPKLDLLSLTEKNGTFIVRIANTATNDLWLRASDSNLIAWLEAKSGDTWKPIQFHYWASCGNSYHAVNLPIGYEFVYKVPVARGTLRTQVRLAALRVPPVGSQPTSLPVEHSVPVPFSIDPAQFSLSPEIAKDSEIRGSAPPTLMPKDKRTPDLDAQRYPLGSSTRNKSRGPSVFLPDFK